MIEKMASKKPTMTEAQARVLPILTKGSYMSQLDITGEIYIGDYDMPNGTIARMDTEGKVHFAYNTFPYPEYAQRVLKFRKYCVLNDIHFEEKGLRETRDRLTEVVSEIDEVLGRVI